MNKPHIWLRAETKAQEQRTALTPTKAKVLLDAGFRVTVESSKQNIFPEQQYQDFGCEIKPQGSWLNSPADTIILGLKELTDESFALIHRHIYFAHVYKEQQGWQDLLGRFEKGQGQLYDLEYLVDDKNRRIAAFGYWAGFSGAALAILAWANQQKGQLPALNNVKSYNDKYQLITELSAKIHASTTKPKIMVIGAKGRSGKGAVAIAKELNLEVIEWDLAETKKGGPFAEINEHDILINCVFISGPTKENGSNEPSSAFITQEILASQTRKLSVITDVSCDPYGDYNPLPIYQECTTFESPCIEIIAGKNPLSLIAIDHLPSLLPKESSEDYGEQLLTHLLTLDDASQGVWPRALAIFEEKLKEKNQ